MSILLLADHDGAKLSPETAKALTAALQLGAQVDILVAGQGVGEIAKSAATLSGAARVLVADEAEYAHILAEPIAGLVVSLASGYSAIVSAATSTGKNTLPRVAALLDVMQVSDVIAVLGPNTFKRPIYAGNAIQTVESIDPVQVLTVRTTAFEAAPSTGSAPIGAVAHAGNANVSRFVSAEIAESDRPDLSGAKIVISGGRGLGSKDQFETLLTPLADALGGALGASRAAVDAGYAPNDWQVGQTGKVVAPDLYIAVGISGAIQHIAGMKDAKTIVAINKDADAPIFQVADYGLVGDLFDIIPQLTAAVRK
jgi:electron transfer flavoprotein alpha subunit